MEATAELVTSRPVDAVRPFVDDLSAYPQWMRLIYDVAVDSVPPHAPALDATSEDQRGIDRAWTVELRARLGPFARSKRLRMVRRAVTEHDDATAGVERLVFERRELDGRQHAPWVLTVELISLDSGGTRLAVRLEYGGRLWTGGVLDRILADEIARARETLLSLLGER